MIEFDNKVYISYKWGRESERLVNKIDKSLQKKGLVIVRDKRDLGYKDSIKEFMRQIGKGMCVIVVVSDEYLRSSNCMFELVEIAANKQFRDRIFPVVLSDADIYDPVRQLEYVKHWEDKRKKLANAIKKVDPANLQGIRDEMDNYHRFRSEISGLTSILKDMNTLTPQTHRDTNFNVLYKSLEDYFKAYKVVPTDDQSESILISIDIPFNEFTSARKKDLINALSSMLNVDEEVIKVLKISAGSVIIRLKMPKDATHLLYEKAIIGNSEIQGLQIKSILMEGKYFIGRDKIVDKITSALLHNISPIVITGMGGIGKTSLVKQIANKIESEFGGNIFWGDLSTFNGDPIPLLRQWTIYLGQEIPPDTHAKELANIVRVFLTKRKKSLIIIDDLRSEWLESGKILYSAAPAHANVVITTREKSVAASLHATQVFDLERLSDSESIEMLITFSENKIDAIQAKIIAELCGNVPLALELAAQVAKADGSNYLLEKLDSESKRLDVLKVGSRTRKEESIKVTFKTSYEILPITAALVFRYLGAFAPVGITNFHLANVLNYSKKKNNAEEGLHLLRLYSLIQDDNDGESYRAHVLLHDYAKELLKGKEAMEARLGHFMCFQKVALSYTGVDLTNRNNSKTQEYETYYPQMAQALENFSLEYKNGKIKGEQLSAVFALIDTLDKRWVLNDEYRLQVKWLKFAYEIACKAKQPLKQADFARRVGRVNDWQGWIDEGLEWMKKCEIALRGNQSTSANAVRAHMYIYRASLKEQKDLLAKAEKDCKHGIGMVTEKSQPRICAEGYNLLGVIYLKQDKYYSRQKWHLKKAFLSGRKLKTNVKLNV